MLRDVFYFGNKPNVHPREKPAKDLDHARSLCTTEHFWIINEFCDYTGFDWEFDFDFLPDEDVWAKDHNNVWPGYYQKDSGTWLCNKEHSDITIYRNDVVAIKRKVTKDNWTFSIPIDKNNFDFSWSPDPIDPPYIYQFGTQWQKTGGPRYVREYATEIKYINSPCATALPDKSNWVIPDNIDSSKFDFSWHPDDTSPPYIYEFGTQWYDRGGPKYIVPGASTYKYINSIVAKTKSDKSNWKSLLAIDEENFDYSWVPHPYDPPYIYVFGNQWHKAEIEPTIQYIVPGATQIKYINDIIAKVLPDESCWKILHDINKDKFDFSWRPNPKDPPYIYAWGNKFYPVEIGAAIEYHTLGATEIKYMTETVEVLPEWDRWVISPNVDRNKFDFTWRPDPREPAYIYRWGNKFYPVELDPMIEYHVPGATHFKYMTETVELVAQWNKWVIIQDVDKDTFDFSWYPDPREPPYIYVFGNQWHKAEVEPTIEYHVPEATEKKYMSNRVAKVLPVMECWEIADSINVDDFDFSWRPNPGAPPYIYQFGTLQDDNDGPVYKPVNNNGEIVKLSRVYKEKNQAIVVSKYYIKTTLQDLVNEHPNEVFWAMRENIDYTKFNFEWRPKIINVAWESDYVHVFGSIDSELTHTYFVNAKSYLKGKRELKYLDIDKKVDAEYLATLFKQNDMFFVDKGNLESNERYEMLRNRYPNIQKTRFLNTWVDTINRCINRSKTELCWILNSELDYSKFDFNYHPNLWQMKMIHVFGTQWNQWGTTFIVNKNTFSEDTKYIKIIEHLSNINIVKDRRAIATNNVYDIWLVDHGNDLTQVKETLERKSSGKSINIIPYDNSYLQTFKNLVKNLPDKKEDYVWLCSSICDYSTFDFSYTVDPFSRDNLHVFPSDQQKFGDTFFIDVNKTKEIIDSIDRLQAYPKVNYNNILRIKRLPAPVINVENDTLVDAINTDYNFPYAVFQTEQVDVVDQEPLSLWSKDMKTIVVTTKGATRIIVPKEARDIVKKELYDYPYIKTASKLGSSKPMDIVFLSNGELCADANYEHLLAVTRHTKNRVVRVDGVNGRVAAYHAAVEASNTPWALTVFAKLKVNNNFDWSWQPDRMQIPKHYIFNARNPVNGLEYGHQAMIAYNKKLTIANQGVGLDFTLDDPHESVNLLSGIAYFNTDPYATWRTAFREVIKLQSDYSDISIQRLKIWTTIAEGDFAQDCLQGAKDAVEFYDSVMGDIDELKKSYEWAWLKEFYRKKYR